MSNASLYLQQEVSIRRRKGIDDRKAGGATCKTASKVDWHYIEDWYKNDFEPRLMHPNIPARIYRMEIKLVIGKFKIQEVAAPDVER